MINYEKRIKDRLNTLKSELAKLRHPKLTKTKDIEREVSLERRITELKSLIK